MSDFDFNNLFVLDLANNHQGDIKHARNIIKKYSNVIKKSSLKATIKFQFRQLDTFIHPKYDKFPKNKHIDRFKTTRLSLDDYKILLQDIKNLGLLSCCTPFDEESVDIIREMNFDLVKIASCSAKDWPLIESIVKINKPIVCSTGGLKIDEIDDLVSFFEHRGCEFSLMHCVSIYPTPIEKMNLGLINILIKRYPHLTIGWSTHESPDDYDIVKIAYSQGARMFEKHIGLNIKQYKLNAYSCDIDQFEKWIESYKKTMITCGFKNTKFILEEEIDGINTLLRGVYAKKKITKGQKLTTENVFFAMPFNKGQLESGNFSKDLQADKNYNKNEPINKAKLKKINTNDSKILKKTIHVIKAMLRESKIILNTNFEVEYSHHYGLKNFYDTGAVIINCINRSYCKKLIIMLPNQKHPAHFHKKKEETFQILSGELEVYLDGRKHNLRAGQTCLIQPGVWHSFSSKIGCIFEEVSTTHFNDDSYYKDKKINEMKRAERKTTVENWGRFEI